MKINKSTTILSHTEYASPVAYALKGLRKDMSRIFGQEPVIADQPSSNQIRLQTTSFNHEEGFRIQSHEDFILIEGSDGLGLVFGIYYFCEKYLGVDAYEFWTDYSLDPQDEITLSRFTYTARVPKVRFRGWFINDEDCLMGWHDDIKISLATWEQIYETLLRAGYNMVIPGTGISLEDPQLQLASEMGLWITQHHAEPLGAPMFSDVYPDIPPTIPEEKKRFIALYKEAISQNKGRKVVWALGFRGQGDQAFFENDPRYDTLPKRGALISEMIKLQKNLVLQMTDGPQYFVHYIYAESAELYRQGYLQLDDDIIRVWADNGFGAMRMRRNFGPEDHIPSLPLANDSKKPNGVYYHVSFHDLQISNKLVPLVDPELIREQFQLLFEAGDIHFLILNVSNIHPHVFNIELINKLARFSSEETLENTVSTHYHTWTHRHFPGFEVEIQNLMKQYYQAPFQYGSYKDDKAGEQVYHHTLRNCIKGTLKNKPVDHLMQFIPNCPANNNACFRWLLDRAQESLPNWETLYQEAEALYQNLSGRDARYFSDSIQMHINYMYYSCQGFVFGLEGLLAYSYTDYKSAFCFFNEGKQSMDAAWKTLKDCEHDKWLHFYRGEWLTDTRETIRYLETMRGLAKIMGDTSHWRSEWMMDALQLKKRTIQTITQASTSYDRLAHILYQSDGTKQDDDILSEMLS